MAEPGTPNPITSQPPTSEQTQAEAEKIAKEAVFEKMIGKLGNGIAIKTSSEHLNQSIKFYQNNKKYGVPLDDPAMQDYAEEFKKEIGCDIEEFLAYLEIRAAE